jgi:hypothetical protein
MDTIERLFLATAAASLLGFIAAVAWLELMPA